MKGELVQGSPVTLDSEQEASGMGNVDEEVVNLESGAAARKETESEVKCRNESELQCGGEAK
jgi:hypothetical protein